MRKSHEKSQHEAHNKAGTRTDQGLFTRRNYKDGVNASLRI